MQTTRDWWLLFLKLLMWVGLAQGVVWTLLSLGCFIHTTIFTAKSVKTTGTVVELHKNIDDDGALTYSPVFQFTTKDGATQTVTSNSGSNPPGFEIGTQVPIRYEPSDPSAAAINTFWQTWPFAAGFGIAAVVMTLFGLFFRWRVKKRIARPLKLKTIQSLDQI